MRIKALIAVLGLALFSAGCSQLVVPRLSAGTPLKEVQSRAGAPHDQRTLPNGGKAWDYVYGPLGFQTWRVTFDGSDRVAGVEQLLQEKRFWDVPANKLTRQDVTNLFGRPGQMVTYANLDEEVWTYRFMDVSFYKLADFHFDRKSGLAKYHTVYLDPAYYNTVSE